MNELQITQFMHHYCETFRPGNAEKMGMFFKYPFMMLASGKVLNMNSSDELVSFLSDSLLILAANNFAYSKVHKMYVHSLSGDIAVVSAHFKRMKSDGSVLEEIAATYNLVKEGELDWKIVLVAVHDVGKVIVKRSA